MGLLRRRPPVSKRVREAQERVGRIATHALIDWSEQCLYVYGRCLADHSTASKQAAGNMLEEAVLAAEVARVIAEELQRRLS